MAGALAEPVDGAVFVFKDMTKEVGVLQNGLFIFLVSMLSRKYYRAQEIEEFAKQDPYVINGLVPKWEVRKYLVVASST